MSSTELERGMLSISFIVIADFQDREIAPNVASLLLQELPPSKPIYFDRQRLCAFTGRHNRYHLTAALEGSYGGETMSM